MAIIKSIQSLAAAWLRKCFQLNSSFFRMLQFAAWPFIDLGVRVWLAQIFFVSGVIKVTHWQTALNLAANEYPVPWMHPVTAAYTGVAIELIGPALLALGLLTRYAAIPMLILSLVIQVDYLPFDNQLFWMAFFGWYVVHGAGPISMDNLLRRGLADSALPLAPRIVKVSSWVRLHLSPVYLAAIRIWMACTLLRLGAPESGIALPLSTSAHYGTSALALLSGGFLLLGFLTRQWSLALAVTTFGGAMLDPRLTDDVYLLMIFALLSVRGGGWLSLDSAVGAWLERFPQFAGNATFALEGVPRVVIVGAGFGGMSCAAKLRDKRLSVTLVDRANYHLFQPLLYQVATAAINPSDIAAPIRPLFRHSFNTRVLLGTVTGVDSQRKVVKLGDKELPYDYLVLATGAAHSYFGKDQWSAFAPGLKRIEDATEIRRKLLTAFELAEATDDDDERAALLTFLIVGGGPTGVELAGAIAELARFGMDKEFRRFDPASARVVLVQSAPRILPTFDETLSVVAKRSLEKLGVEVFIGRRVENIDANGVWVNGERIAARTVLWAAGVMASPAAAWLKCEADGAGRVKVDADLAVPGLSGVFAIGDTALSAGWNGQPVPGLAPAAKQGGYYVARRICATIEGQAQPSPFKYRHRGSLATIGRKSAVADFGFIKLWGAPAWWLWGIVHVGFLVGLRNRLSTMMNWFWAYLTFGGGIRLITGSGAESKPSLDCAPAARG
ncbi:MAG: NAD(P)/FAD-dependent oxidoreductase [Gammaproteobacteria bacterium]